MTKIINAIAAIAVCGIALTATQASANGPRGPQDPHNVSHAPIAGIHFTGKELRYAQRDWRGGHRHELWRFGPNGTVRGNFSSDQNVLRGGIYHASGSDGGRWFTAGSQLCVQWRKWRGGRTTCYGISRIRPGRIRMVDPVSGKSRIAHIGTIG